MPGCLRNSTADPIVEGVIVVAIMVALLAVVLLAVVLIADRVAVICAQDRLARQIQDWGFSVKPHVTIAGFPFLTQVAARRLNKVVIMAAGKKLGPVKVRHLDLTLHGIRGSGNGRTASQLSGTALIGFAGLTGMPGLTLAADGPDRVKITVGRRVTGTATARVTRAGSGGIRIAVICAGGIPMALLGSLRDITVPLPALPLGMRINGVSVTGQGVLVHIAGQNVSFGN